MPSGNSSATAGPTADGNAAQGIEAAQAVSVAAQPSVGVGRVCIWPKITQRDARFAPRAFYHLSPRMLRQRVEDRLLAVLIAVGTKAMNWLPVGFVRLKNISEG